MDRGAWWATVHGVTKNRTQLKGIGIQGGVLDQGPGVRPMFGEEELVNVCASCIWR